MNCKCRKDKRSCRLDPRTSFYLWSDHHPWIVHVWCGMLTISDEVSSQAQGCFKCVALFVYVCMVCAMAYLYGTFEFESSLLWNVFCCFMYTTNVFPSTGANDRRMFAKPQTISAQVSESLSGQITDTTLSQPAIHYLAIWLKFYLFSFGWTGRSIIRTKISLGS